MNKNLKHIFRGLFIATLVATTAGATTNVSRSAVNMERARATGTTAVRAKQPGVNQRGNAVPARSTRTVATRSATQVATPTTPNRSSVGTFARATNIISNAGDAIIRRAFGINRAATNQKTSARVAVAPTVARMAVPKSASRARATAVFSDMSKLGDGYNSCRQAYNTCMDQFCAGANETYRRCFCSNTFHDLSDREDALNTATQMLASFESNNLDAVTKTAEEVNAMYSATAGEMAIKKDTSASAALLADIGDLLSGKKKASSVKATTTTPRQSLTGVSLDFSSDFDDIWGSGTSLFTEDSGTDLSTLEGVELYNNAHTQCMQLVGSTCEAGAVRNMAKSAYSILITQDCNAYQKKLDTKTEQVKTTVRTAEKYLREARLEEYRSHNSADVNECLDKVEQAMLASTACGPNYEKCLDYSGVYINMSTGDPIYSPRLFKLNELIVLDGVSADVLSQNTEFDQFLDSKRVYVKGALDTCRDIADVVWGEFKRNALIKISQAQDEKIEEVKMSCVSTMKECYDAQSAALKGFDDTTAQASGALAARASKDMCVDKVAACAALYAKEGDEECNVDTKTGKIKNADKCGLASLRNFVDNVDEVRVAEGCGTAVDKYLHSLCGDGDDYPWNCRIRKFGDADVTKINWTTRSTGKDDIVSMVVNYALENCAVKTTTDGDNGTVTKYSLEARVQDEIVRTLGDAQMQLTDKLRAECDKQEGAWSAKDMPGGTLLSKFYRDTFGGNTDDTVTSLGKCYENTTMVRCQALNENNAKKGEMATYNAGTDECILSEAWYKQQCALLGDGYYENGVCYVAKSQGN